MCANTFMCHNCMTNGWGKGNMTIALSNISSFSSQRADLYFLFKFHSSLSALACRDLTGLPDGHYLWLVCRFN